MTFGYVEPTKEKNQLMQKFRDAFEKLKEDIEFYIKASRGKSLCITKLEEASFWLNKSITEND